MKTMKLHYNTFKETGEVGDWRSEAAHWHLSTKFHSLCHDLTNSSTHCKHGSQPLHSKWGLHTPFQISWPMWNFPLKFLFIVALPHSLNLQPPPPFQTSHRHETLRHWYLFTRWRRAIFEMGNICSTGPLERFKRSDSVGIIMSCEEARNQSIRRHAPLWLNHGLRN